jgi:predicted membrane protein
METKNTRQFGNSFWIGIIVIAIGTLVLFDTLDFDIIPGWIINPGSLLLVIGVAVGIRKNFQGIGWLILIGIGSFIFIESIPGIDYDIRKYIFPAAIISVGLLLLYRSTLPKPAENIWTGTDEKKNSIFTDSTSTSEDYINVTSVFGGSTRRIFSKNFKGGQATAIFGGSDIDLSQADIEGTIVIDMVSIFGGCKLIVPSNWELKSDITAILGGVDDKRANPTALESNKKIILKGVCLFGGVEIKNF